MSRCRVFPLLLLWPALLLVSCGQTAGASTRESQIAGIVLQLGDSGLTELLNNRFVLLDELPGNAGAQVSLAYQALTRVRPNDRPVGGPAGAVHGLTLDVQYQAALTVPGSDRAFELELNYWSSGNEREFRTVQVEAVPGGSARKPGVFTCVGLWKAAATPQTYAGGGPASAPPDISADFRLSALRSAVEAHSEDKGAMGDALYSTLKPIADSWLKAFRPPWPFAEADFRTGRSVALSALPPAQAARITELYNHIWGAKSFEPQPGNIVTQPAGGPPLGDPSAVKVTFSTALLIGLVDLEPLTDLKMVNSILGTSMAGQPMTFGSLDDAPPVYRHSPDSPRLPHVKVKLQPAAL